MSERIIVGHCSACGAELVEREIEPYGESECHVVPNYDQDGDAYPEPCGPVIRSAAPEATSAEGPHA